MKKLTTLFVIIAIAASALAQKPDQQVGAAITTAPAKPVSQQPTSGSNPADLFTPNYLLPPIPYGNDGIARAGVQKLRERMTAVEEKLDRLLNARRGLPRRVRHAGSTVASRLDQEIVQMRKLRGELKGEIAAIDKKLSSPSGQPATTASTGANAADKPEEGNTMWNALTVSWVIVGLLLIFSIGHWIWGNLVHNRGLHDQNHKQTGEFIPDHAKWGEFRDSTTKQSHDRYAVSEPVAIARANASAVGYLAETDKQLALLAAANQRHTNLMALITQPAAPMALAGAGGYQIVPQLPLGGSGAPEAKPEAMIPIEHVERILAATRPAAKEQPEQRGKQPATTAPAKT